MLNSKVVIHVNPAHFPGIFKKVDDDGLEVILLLFKFCKGVLEYFPCKLSVGHSAIDSDFILDADIRHGDKLDVSICVQVQRIWCIIKHGCLATECSTINPNLSFLGF